MKIEKLKAQKQEVQIEIEDYKKSSHFLNYQKLLKRKTYLTRQISMNVFREKRKLKKEI